MKIAATPTIPDKVLAALSNASERTGIGFDYLAKTAQRESSFNPQAKARTSSATGLFQFIESTWLGVVRENGERFGLDDEAAAIRSTGRGRLQVADPQMRDHILSLRSDPDVAALMAGAFTEDNADYLRKAIGRDPSEGELYIAHFLGAGGAAKMISLAESRPTDRAADHFPAAARANRSIFYKGGTASSVQDVYANLVAKHEHTATPAVAARPGASSPRLIEISGEGAPQPIVTPQPVQGGTLFSDLFQPGGRSGLGPAAKSGMGAMSLFSTIDIPRAVAGDSAGAASANASVEETRRSATRSRRADPHGWPRAAQAMPQR